MILTTVGGYLLGRVGNAESWVQALGAGQRNIAAAIVVATMNFGSDEVVMVVEAAAPHFDFDSAGWQADGQENFSFSYVDPSTGDLRVAHVDGNAVKTAVVAHGQTPVRPAGMGNDLAGTSLSYSQPNVIGGSGVA